MFDKVKAGSILSEFYCAIRFGWVGVFATAIHMLILWALLSETFMPTMLANTIAFIISFGFSFLGHYFWTFNSPGSPYRVILRYSVVAGSTFTISTALLAVLLSLDWATPKYIAVGSALVVPPITFLANRIWAFKTGH